MQSLLGLVTNTSANISIELDGQDTRKKTTIRVKGEDPFKLLVYTGDDDISGVVDIRLKGKNQTIKELKQNQLDIQVLYDSKQNTDFMSMSRELEPVGTLLDDKKFKFLFPKFEKQMETYYGNTAKIRYFLRVTINRQYGQKIQQNQDFAVILPNPQIEKLENNIIRLEVGIQECLHIEFEFSKDKYHLKDCLIGKVSFLLVKIRIKHMQLQIIKQETTYNNGQPNKDNDTLVDFEIMDGCPRKGEVIPIRLYLSGVDLTPSYTETSYSKFQVKHFINLILIDDEGKRYFKQQEITVYRKK
ncbi:hypothetical protein IMG5_154790 [Ichthyophthirius multifiliis]|uniref:Vacuolar protein sorting-associated protein 26 n=1 Tax=Ichthyophthirius multifiliis TaxID=5932 RepID=G0QZ73_ICHMU|nr:hypothetical protein IMG5_154790 [Ichthyophthirius multifiliis]EGR29496.1 hypothetical protein IMG5_154790 [Ichthyophthirius multifiliis]|eukprot:XP_004030732.1 hypothetical protein IMG5_154790 [Ichthyophthirius multifiliis]